MAKKAPTTAVNEESRLRALAEYGFAEAPPAADLDRLAHVAARLFDAPIVLVSLMQRDRQVCAANIGLETTVCTRAGSFCSHAMAADDVFVVHDARSDPRFAFHPQVVGMPGIRFYAGAPLLASAGERLGVICVIDVKPRMTFSALDRRTLADIATLVTDAMERRRLDQARAISQSRFENIAFTSPDAIVCSNTATQIIFWNSAAEKLFGYAAGEAIGRPIGILVPPPDDGHTCNLDLRRFARGEVSSLAGTTVELPARRRDGSIFPAEISFSTWREGAAQCFGAIIRDITERRENEARLHRLACCDPLTGLPNRAALRMRMEEVTRTRRAATVLLLDLDGFKDVNDTLGHGAGDEVLKQVAERVTLLMCADSILARLGGDEFVVLLPHDDPERAAKLAGALVLTLSEPFKVAAEVIHIGVSIGIALTPLHGNVPDELLGAVDLALYRAKASGRGRYEFFDANLREAAVARRAYDSELRGAFAQNEFELYFQPQVSLDDGRIRGAEALIRWNHPTRGLLAPGAFLDVLNESTFAAAVGEWTIRAACAHAATWREAIPRLRVGVNLFEAQFRTGRLVASVEEALAEHGLPGDALELEITENIIVGQDEAMIAPLKRLRALGVGIAFDDYGTGFASLSLLKRFPVTRLKIDRSFVRDACTDAEDAAVVRAIIYLGQSFGLEVIAEGVETLEQKYFLRRQRCAEAQGYLLGKPMPASDFTRSFVSDPLKQIA